LLAGAIGWAFWRILPSNGRFQRRETLFLFLLLALGLLLFCWPAECFPQMGDSSIYPNTAALLVRTGGLTYHYDPLDGLTLQQKQLFYVPSDKQLSYMEIQSYEGLLYGAYYVMDPEQNTIVSSRPPLAIVWTGLFGMLGGEQGMLYVTPIFGAASLIVVYFTGKRLFDTGSGALTALWLLVSFPQLYFSRAPFAEVLGQFFVLTALYAWIIYLQERRLTYIGLGIAALTAGFATRLDVFLALPTLFLFLVLLVMRGDWKGIIVGMASLGVSIAFTVWTVNRPYVGATSELLLVGQLRFLRQLSFPLAIIVGLGGLLGFTLVALLARYMPPGRPQKIARWGLSLGVILGVGYALHIRPLMPEYVLVNGEPVPTQNEALMAIASRYTSPLFFWLAACGMVVVFWRRPILHEQVLAVFFTASFGAMFFWRYTTARVYPVALRRLLPEVLPGFSLLGASALRWIGQRSRWRWMATVVAGLVIVSLMSVSGRYWFHQGAVGAWDSLSQLAAHLPPDAIVLFEPRQDGSVVGWFAAPLWSFYQRDALLFNNSKSDSKTLYDALCFWQTQGRDIYLVSQQDPSNWWPGEFQGRKEGETIWNSSIIGQSQRFPPFVWRFAFAFSIYRLETAYCVSP